MTKPEKRESWSNRAEFILSCVGYSVGFGNIWRFPYLCYRNGGGAFLLPYLFSVVIIGVPMMFLETSLGQFTRKGSVGMWDLCPLMKGAGYTTMVYASLSCISYTVILAWAGYYFAMSFSSVLPWTHCDNAWNTERCRVPENTGMEGNSSTAVNVSHNISSVKAPLAVNTSLVTNSSLTNVTGVHPSVEFWWRHTLRMSSGLEEAGELNVHLVVSLLLCWVVAYFCIFRGVRWSGKVVYFTAIFPYVLLITLLIQSAWQPGAGNGIMYYIKPRFDKLGDTQVWFEAASQVLFSYAVALTALPAYGSYCPFNGNCYRDGIIVSIINSSTSLLSGFVVFSILGYMAHAQGVSIDAVATSGPGLAFVIYPQALGMFPLPQLWSVLFFVMMILVGLDSLFPCLEGILASFWDTFPKLFKWRMLILLVFVAIEFLLGLSMVTEGGMYVFQLSDYYLYGAFIPQLLCFMEVVMVGWVYGADRFYDNIQAMIGFRINPWMKICWKVFTPLALMILIIAQLIRYRPLVYNKTYVYPTWVNVFGLCFTVLIMLPVLLVAVYTIQRSPGDGLRQRLRWAVRSKLEQRRDETATDGAEEFLKVRCPADEDTTPGTQLMAELKV